MKSKYFIKFVLILSYILIIPINECNLINVLFAFENFSDLNIVPSWIFSSTGIINGKNFINASDIDNNGIVDIICCASPRVTTNKNIYWYVLEYSISKNTYDIKWTSNTYTSNITCIKAIKIDNQYKIYVSTENGDLFIYDGSTLEIIQSLNTDFGLYDIKYYDIDYDSKNEMIVICGGSIRIYSIENFNLEYEYEINAGITLEIGNVDNDIYSEIVLNNYVLEYKDGQLTEEWSSPAGSSFGFFVYLCDTDSDNIEEIIGVQDHGEISVYDVDTRSKKWEMKVAHDIGSSILFDIDGDKKDELIYSEQNNYRICCLDLESGNHKRTISTNTLNDIYSLVITDIDFDNDLEVILSADEYIENVGYHKGNIYLYDLNTFEPIWSSIQLTGPFTFDCNDINQDGINEIVIGSYRSIAEHANGILSIFDSINKTLKWQSEINFFHRICKGINRVRIGDVDNDGEREIVVATDSCYTGAIYIVNGNDYHIENIYLFDPGTPINTVQIYDIDMDGDNEIIAGGNKVSSASNGSKIYIIDGSSGQIEWQSDNLEVSTVFQTLIDDIDNDSVPEIIVNNGFIYFYIYDGITHEVTQFHLPNARGFETYDTDYDGIKELLLGMGTGDLYIYDWQTETIEDTLALDNNKIYQLKLSDLNSDKNIELLYTTEEGRLKIADFTSMDSLWQSNTFEELCYFEEIFINDFDNDLNAEIFTSSDYNVIEYKNLIHPTLVESQKCNNEISGVKLFTNYPNPFNSNTVIKFNLDNSKFLKISIYNLLGQEVEIISESFVKSGYHEVIWNTKNISSGLYFCQIESQNSIQTIKLLLQK